MGFRRTFDGIGFYVDLQLFLPRRGLRIVDYVPDDHRSYAFNTLDIFLGNLAQVRKFDDRDNLCGSFSHFALDSGFLGCTSLVSFAFCTSLAFAFKANEYLLPGLDEPLLPFVVRWKQGTFQVREPRRHGGHLLAKTFGNLVNSKGAINE